MCGIVGIAGHLTRERLATEIKGMNTALAHRGPDDEGSWVGENFAFGMRRLSIIDLGGGHQPMWDVQSGLGIVYNGEVYNYQTVRADLAKSGLNFQTTSDTEVVLKSFALKGTNAVHQWNGMFAAALWDDRDKKLLLIRDRLGKKPLYYYWDGAILMFASELKSFLASTLFPRRVNPQAVWDYLTYQYVPGPETIWRNVWKLPPGHMLEWHQNGEPRIFPYWKTDVRSSDEAFDIDQKEREFTALFLDSVEKRLLAADVPVGVLLSGGLDSSSVAAAAVELGHKQFHTFSVGFSDGGDYSELGYARQVANHLGIQCHEITIDRSRFLEMLPEAVRAADEPLADQASVPLLAVSRLARERVKVVLSGEGGDEVFAGYDFEMFHRTYETIRRIQQIPPFLLKPVSRALTVFSERLGTKLARVANTPLSQWNFVHTPHMTRMWNESEKALLWPSFNGRSSESVLQGMYSEAGSKNPLDQTLSVYQKSWLVEDLLMKADKMSMAASLELRVPFLDYRLVEWANRQPLGVRIGHHGGKIVTKHVLRRFAQKRLPQEIIERPKRGFPVPMYQWLKDDQFTRWAHAYLTGSEARLPQFFGAERMSGSLRLAATGNRQAAAQSWLLIVLETWFREFEVDVADDTPIPSNAALVLG